jgi:hypothetical protein
MNSNIGSLSLWKITLAIALAVASLAPSAYADTVTINFDSLTVAPGSYISGAPVTNYLAGYGITLSGMKSGEIVTVSNLTSPNCPTEAPSPPNVFGVWEPYQISTFTLNFSTPVNNFSFDRFGSIGIYNTNGTAMGPWSATAYNASGGNLGSAGDPLISTYGDVPVKSFTIAAPGISHIDFIGNNEGWTGYCLPMIDNLSFTTSPAPVPLPGSLLLLGSGLLGLAGWRRFRKG